MRSVVSSLLAAILVASAPFAARAQTASTPAPAAAAPAPATPAPAPEAPSAAAPAPAAVPAPAPAPAPAAPKVTVTPYGFLLFQAFLNDGPFSQKDGGFQALANHDGGAFIMDARGSRIGFKIAVPDDPWTGAKINGTLEFDFKAGQIPSNVPITCTNSSTPGNPPNCTAAIGAPSTAWYNPVPRMRLGYMSATWALPDGKLILVAGQDWGLIAPLSATSLAWGFDPLFQQAGNIWRRAPQLKLTYEFGGASFGGSIAAAALSPVDNNFSAPSTPPQYAADYGAGNRSQLPHLEARAAAWYKESGKKVAELGISGHYDWRRYSPAGSLFPVDVHGKIIAADLQVNLPFVTIQGEGFLNNGADDSVNGIAPAVITTGTTQANYTVNTVKSRGVWGQVVIKPVPEIQIPFGFGVESIGDISPTLIAQGLSASQRNRNYEISGGIILNANNPWKFGVEVLHTISKYDFQSGDFNKSAAATQYCLASKLDF